MPPEDSDQSWRSEGLPPLNKGIPGTHLSMLGTGGTTGRGKRREKRDLACPQVPSLPGGDTRPPNSCSGARLELSRLVQPSTYHLFRGRPQQQSGFQPDCRTHRLPASGLQFMYPNLPEIHPDIPPSLGLDYGQVQEIWGLH